MEDIKVILLHDSEIRHVYSFGKGKPVGTPVLPWLGGSEYSLNEAEVRDLLDEEPEETKRPKKGDTTAVTNVTIYPEDKLLEVKEKIFLATQIPVYRQHLFYISSEALIESYEIFVEGDIHYIDPMNPRGDVDSGESTSLMLISNIPIEKYLYDKRESLFVRADDEMLLVQDHVPDDNTFYLIDLASYINPERSRLASLVRDSYYLDIIYYGFVLKYWPMMTKEVFKDYLMDEKDLPAKFPDLAKSARVLEYRYRQEKKIADTVRRDVPGEEFMKTYPIAITGMNLKVPPEYRIPSINMRNLFNELVASKHQPEITCVLEHDNKKFLAKKSYAKRQIDAPFPKDHRGLTIAVMVRDIERERKSTVETEQVFYLFLTIMEDCEYYIRASWGEEDGVKFDGAFSFVKSIVTPIVDNINSMVKPFLSRYRLQPVTETTAEVTGLTVSMYWKKVVTDYTFRMVRKKWDEYIDAKLVSPRAAQQKDRYELLFRKGMHHFSHKRFTHVAIPNQYAYMSNLAIKQRWEQFFSGKVVKVYHRMTDMKLEITDVREDEFFIFYRYAIRFIESVASDPGIGPLLSGPVTKHINRLQQLREYDPELYNLKKHGSERLYSTACQGERRPIIKTEEETAGNPGGPKLWKYWNFTYKTPVYYSCPSRKYPHLGFITGIHPKGYCLPCCMKTLPPPSSNKGKVLRQCMSTHDTADFEDRVAKKHVVKYGKDIEVGRFGKLPDHPIRHLLNDTVSGNLHRSFCLMGVRQNLPGAKSVGAIFAISAIVQEGSTEPRDFVRNLLGDLKRVGNTFFSSLLRGAITEYFTTVADLTAAMADVFLFDKPFVSRFNQWNELIVEIVFLVYELAVFVLADTGSFIELRAKPEFSSANKLCLIFTRGSFWYPVVVIDRKMTVLQTTWDSSSEVGELLGDAVRYYESEHLQKMKHLPDATMVGAVARKLGHRITTKLVNKQNMCYAVMVEDCDGSDLYFAVEYSAPSSDGVPVSYHVPKGKLGSRASLLKFITKVNRYIDKYADDYRALELQYYCQAEGACYGVVCNGACFYFHPEDVGPVGIPVVDTMYNWMSVNSAITGDLPPTVDPLAGKLGESLYSNYLYQMLLLEFVNFTENERNEPVRAEIEKIIDGKYPDYNGIDDEVKPLLSLADQQKFERVYYDMLMRTLRSNGGVTKEDIKKMVSVETFEFDRLTIGRIRQAKTRENMETLLHEVVANFAVEAPVDKKSITIDNVYLPCSSSADSPGYCQGRKLIVDTDGPVKLRDMISILADDLTNDFKMIYMFKDIWYTNIIDYFKFDDHPMEIIELERL